MATTTNFGWETPDDTDLVKDGALAMRTLGNSIDTSFVDLKGGTTGQILSKASNTDLDYTWINNDQGDITAVNVTSPITGGGTSGAVTVGIDDATTTQKGAVQLEDSTSSTSTTKAATPNSVKTAYDLANGAIPKSLIDAEGDLIVGDAADAVQRLALGTNGQVLTVDTAVDGKIKWANATTTPAYVGVSASKSAAQSINNSTDTVITFDVEQFDTDGFHSNSTNTSRFTIPTGKGGKYLVNATTQFADNATGVRTSSILKNGNLLLEMEQVSAASQGTTRISGGGVFDLTAGDYVEMRVWQNSGGALNVNGTNSYTTTMQLTYMGA